MLQNTEIQDLVFYHCQRLSSDLIFSLVCSICLRQVVVVNQIYLYSHHLNLCWLSFLGALSYRRSRSVFWRALLVKLAVRLYCGTVAR